MPGDKAVATPSRYDLRAALKASQERAWPLVMAILNVTPDSFSDGGRFLDPWRATDQALAYVEQGADIIDIGGNSTRPGALDVDLDTELARVLPVIEGIRKFSKVAISIDSSKAQVMQAAAAAGANIINDVEALRSESALQVAAQLQLPVILMHMLGQPRTMQRNPQYDDVVAQVGEFLLQRVQACAQAGIDTQRIVLDPGFGFGKTLQHNLLLLRHLEQIAAHGFPVLVGLSRKAMAGQITGRDVAQRMPASLAFAFEAACRGANIIRVHDVAATVDVLKVRAAIAGVEQIA